MAITDKVSVMRRGEMVATRETAKTTVEELAELMVGRRVLLRVEKGAASRARSALRQQSDGQGRPRRHLVDNVSFDVRAGEIVGIAGVAGNGQSELLEAICRHARAVSGSVMLDGNPIDVVGHADPGELRDRGLAHVPEDRHHVGWCWPSRNAKIPSSAITTSRNISRARFSTRRDPRRCRKKIEKFDIRPHNRRLKTANFSGGNQQKIVLAREMERDPDVLLVGQPTRGVDIGAIEFIHKQLIAMRDAGKAILLVSVELDEIRSLSDRILVMFDGRIVGERGPEADERELGLLMAGVERRRRPNERHALRKLPGLGRLRPDAADQPGRRLPRRRPGRAAGRREPAPAPRSSWSTAPSASGEGIGYTLYYATNFIFTGLAVAVAFHAGLFNIGGEGQAYIGGLGVGARLPGARPCCCPGG